MPVFDHFARAPDFAAIFNDAMTSLSAGTHPAVVAAYDFSGLHLLVDVGGGHGGLLAGILAANPHLSGIVYDLPQVIEGTRAALAAAGLEHASPAPKGRKRTAWGVSPRFQGFPPSGSPDGATADRPVSPTGISRQR